MLAFLFALHASTACVAIDGDTLVCRVGLRREHLRLNGIDSPELAGHCHAPRICVPGDAKAAKANLASLVNGRRVIWTPLGTDKYGRTIAEARAKRVDLQCAQLTGGFAVYVPRWDNKGTLRALCPAAK